MCEAAPSEAYNAACSYQSRQYGLLFILSFEEASKGGGGSAYRRYRIITQAGTFVESIMK